MSKILAIDYGTKKFGLAVSDEDKMFARTLPLLFVKDEDDALIKIKDIVEKERVQKILLGLPLNEDGTHSNFSKQIEKFSEKLKSFIDVYTIDESMTSMMARSHAKDMKYKKGNIDGEAARIMLQEYLDYNSE